MFSPTQPWITSPQTLGASVSSTFTILVLVATLPEPSIASNIETTSGKYFKADVYWNDWCARWSTDSTAEDYRFNEADIDWYVRGVGIGSTSLGLYKTYSWLAPFTYNFGTTGANARSKHVIPWPFRPNDYREATSGTYDNLNFVGTQYFNIDANCLFSTATNYIPDPVDEYVYRIVTKKSLLPYFKDDVDTHLKTAIILEYGFTDHNFNAKTTALTTKADIFKKGLLRPGPNRALSLLNKNNVNSSNSKVNKIIQNKLNLNKKIEYVLFYISY